MLGAFVMTQADIMDDRTKVDSVGLGSYNTDSHHVQRFVHARRLGAERGGFPGPTVAPTRSPTGA